MIILLEEWFLKGGRTSHGSPICISLILSFVSDKLRKMNGNKLNNIVLLVFVLKGKKLEKP